jgi:hypothetical protein
MPIGNGAMTAWSDFRDSYCKVYIQYLNNLSEPQWPNNGIVLSTSTNYSQNPKIFKSDNNSAIVVWEEYAYINSIVGSMISYNIQKINTNGQKLWGESAKNLTNINGNDNSYYNIWKFLPDNNGGLYYIYTVEDYPLGFQLGYLANQIGHNKRFALGHISSSGEISKPAELVLPGNRHFNNERAIENSIQRAIVAHDSTIVFNYTYNNSIYMTKLTNTGNFLWHINTKLPLNSGENSEIFQVDDDYIYLGISVYPKQEIIVQKISSNGLYAWDSQPKKVSNYGGGYIKAILCNNIIYFLFVEMNSYNTMLIGIDDSGNKLWENPLIVNRNNYRISGDYDIFEYNNSIIVTYYHWDDEGLCKILKLKQYKISKKGLSFVQELTLAKDVLDSFTVKKHPDNRLYISWTSGLNRSLNQKVLNEDLQTITPAENVEFLVDILGIMRERYSKKELGI